jgi:hypothetical protein
MTITSGTSTPTSSASPGGYGAPIQATGERAFDVNTVSAIADVDVPRTLIRSGVDDLAGVASCRAILFGALARLAQQHVQSFHGDLYHDVHWVDEHVNGPIVFFFGADDCGTAIGTDSSWVRRSRKHVWQVQVTVDAHGTWWGQIVKRYEEAGR